MYVLLFNLTFAYIVAYYSKRTLSEAIPISFMLIILYLYIFSIFDQLKLGVNSFIIGLVLILIVSKIRKNDFVASARILEFKNTEIIIYIFLAIGTFLNSSSMRFKDWDEFSHWGPTVKSMYLFDAIGPYSPAVLVFPEAPPGLSLFPYWITQTSSIWQESLVYWAYQLLAISLLIGTVKFFPINKIFQNVLILISSLLVMTIFFNTFQTIYADALLALFFGYAVYIATTWELTKNIWNKLILALTLALIVLIKDIGIFFALITIIIATVNFKFNPKNSEKIKFTRHLISLIGIAIPTLIALLSWQTVLRFQDIKPGRSLSDLISQIFRGDFSSLNKPYTNEVIDLFIRKSLISPSTTINALPMSSLRWGLVFFVIILFIAFAHNSRKLRLNWITNGLAVLAGFVLYLIILLFLYLTSFVENEAKGLASYERYVTTYLAGIAFLILILISKLIIEKPDQKITQRVAIIGLIVILFQSVPANILSYLANPTSISDGVRGQYSSQSELIEKMGLSVNHKVWIIAQHTIGFEFYYYQYELLPASVGRAPWSIGSSYGPGDIWTDSNLTPEKWDLALNDYDYVFVHNGTESFIKEFGYLFADASSLQKSGFYEVRHNPDGNLLVKVL